MPAAASSVLGFESASNSSVSNGNISNNSAFATDGSQSLSVSGTGHIRVSNSGGIAASTFVGPDLLAVTIFVPEAIPNYYNAGSAEAMLACPNAGIGSAFLGHVELNDVPRGQFNTVTFDIPRATAAALNQNPDAGCTVTVVLNLDGVIEAYAFDRLRGL